MALQGTLDTFALADVLRLLAATGKRGRLDLLGDRGGGTVSVDGGSIVGVSAERVRDGAPPAETLFELLRFTDGTFTFALDEPVASGEPVAIESLLANAEAMLDEWRAIEAIVPTPASRVSLRTDLPEAEVTIDRDSWATLAKIGSGSTAGEVADALELSELPASRRIKSLVDAGLAEVSPVHESAEEADQSAHDESAGDESAADESAHDEAAAESVGGESDSGDTEPLADVVPVVDVGPIGEAPPGDVGPPPPPPPPGAEQGAPDTGSAEEGHGRLRKFLSSGKS